MLMKLQSHLLDQKCLMELGDSQWGAVGLLLPIKVSKCFNEQMQSNSCVMCYMFPFGDLGVWMLDYTCNSWNYQIFVMSPCLYSVFLWSFLWHGMHVYVNVKKLFVIIMFSRKIAKKKMYLVLRFLIRTPWLFFYFFYFLLVGLPGSDSLMAILSTLLPIGRSP